MAEGKSEVGLSKGDETREMRVPSRGGSEQRRNLICTYLKKKKNPSALILDMITRNAQ